MINIKLLVPPGNSATIIVAGNQVKLFACAEADAMLDRIYRFGMLNKNGYSLESNPHTKDLLELFPRQAGLVYVMSRVDADVLAATHRNMDDVYLYVYDDDDFSIAKCYTDRSCYL